MAKPGKTTYVFDGCAGAVRRGRDNSLINTETRGIPPMPQWHRGRPSGRLPPQNRPPVRLREPAKASYPPHHPEGLTGPGEGLYRPVCRSNLKGHDLSSTSRSPMSFPFGQHLAGDEPRRRMDIRRSLIIARPRIPLSDHVVASTSQYTQASDHCTTSTVLQAQPSHRNPLDNPARPRGRLHRTPSAGRPQ